MKKRNEHMPIIDDSPMTKERAEKMYQRWMARKDDMEPIYEDDYSDDPTGEMKVHA